MDAIDIIIPVFNNARLTVACLKSLRLHTVEPIRIILIDNGSCEQDVQTVNEELSHHKDHILHRLPRNFGFGPAVNIGMDLAESSYFCILNNDVVVTPGWLSRMLLEMEGGPQYAALGPVTDNISSVQAYKRMSICQGWPEDIAGEEAARFVAENGKGTFPIEGNLPFFCTIFRKHATDDIGRIYEGFINGGEDDDYNDRLRQEAWTIGVCLGSFVYHEHCATRKLDFSYKQHLHRNATILKHRRMERGAKETMRYKRAVGPAHLYDKIGALQFFHLFQMGMLAHHKFLDFGCGSFRGGRFAIQYLDKGNYYGIEPNQPLAMEGIEENVLGDLIKSKSATIRYSDDCDIAHWGISFDYIMAQSIFSHMAEHQLRTTLYSAAEIVHDSTIFLATYYPGEKNNDRRAWFGGAVTWRPETLREMVEDVGLYMIDVDFYHPNGQKWIWISKQPVEEPEKRIGILSRQVSEAGS